MSEDSPDGRPHEEATKRGRPVRESRTPVNMRIDLAHKTSDSQNLLSTKHEYSVTQNIAQLEWFRNVVAEIVDADEIEFGHASKQTAKLIRSIDAQSVICGRADHTTRSGHLQTEADGFDAAPTTEVEYSNRGRDTSRTFSNRPAFAIDLSRIGRQQVEAENIKSTRLQCCGNALQMSACRLLADQMSKRIDQAMRQVDGF